MVKGAALILKLISITVLGYSLLVPGFSQGASSNHAPGFGSGSVVGELRFHQLPSKIFGNTRTLRVLLPSCYGEEGGTRRYPVLYLNDGQNLFDVATSIFNPLEWEVDETVERLTRESRIPPFIVVGIDNPGKRLRPREYLPYEDIFLHPPEPFPEGTKYPDFIVDEVIPFINERYRTRPGPGGTGIGGSSYGAVAALYTVISKPEVFGYLLLESPSLYIADGRLFEDCRRNTRWPLRIYVGVGTNELGREGDGGQPGDWDREEVQDVLRQEEILRGFGLGAARLRVKVEECARHDEAAWARRLPGALEFLYGE